MAAGRGSLEQQRNGSAQMSRPRARDVLMIYPRFVNESFWNYRESCAVIGAQYPTIPLGLITVAAMLPREWNVRLVNLNTEELSDADLEWADLVMTGGMMFQQAGTLDIIELFIDAVDGGSNEGLFEAPKFQIDVTKTPKPRFDLLKFEQYMYLGVQY